MRLWFDFQVFSTWLLKYSAHWIQRLTSVKGVEVAIDSAVAISKAFNYEMVHFYKQNIDYSDLMLDIATDTGRYLLHKGQILRSLQTRLLFMQWRSSVIGVEVAICSEGRYLYTMGTALSSPSVNFLQALSTQKKTVNEDDMEKLKKFMDDFGQEG